jgi:excisionase family DNA binding protein
LISPGGTSGFVDFPGNRKLGLQLPDPSLGHGQLNGLVAVGRIDLGDRHGGAAEDVLTLDEVAELLHVPSEQVRVRAMEGDLPGRRFGDEWRFLRAAVLAWLAGGPSAA